MGVVGDSIPYNGRKDCPGCKGFVAQYAATLATKTGQSVNIANLSQHNGLDLPGLMSELSGFKAKLRTADAIIVGIVHNSFPLTGDAPCGSFDWSHVGPACADATTKKYAPMYDTLYSTVAGWRAGHSTIVLTINKYNDWLGSVDANLPHSDPRAGPAEGILTSGNAV